ncbi:hypothetical protein [Sphingobacterium gobiense]|uniref:hypothetical protein n=1 Tax=Sphingobacterium gobiense TaxID=1382456 RepID=UPI0015E2EF0B|nr:hypothetical protein [Sphingobacterium gobiense]
MAESDSTRAGLNTVLKNLIEDKACFNLYPFFYVNGLGGSLDIKSTRASYLTR